jgi:hypothetical protein
MATPNLTFNWAGVTQAQTNTAPADSNIAAGINTIITVVTGTHINIYNKTGTQNLYDANLLTFFNLPSNALVFDPRVIWDQFSSRFIVSAAETAGSNSFFDIAVSRSSNPLDGWFFYRFNLGVDDLDQPRHDLDQPRLGLDGSTVYITASFTSNGVRVYNLWAIDRNTLESGTAVPTDLHNFSWTTLGAPNNVGHYTPAHIYGSTSVRDFMVEYVQNNSGSDALNIIQVSNAGTGNPSSNFQSLNVGNISDLELVGARQPGTTITINDQNGFSEAHRIENAVWRGDKLYAVINGIRVGSGADAHDVVHWFVVDTSNPTNLRLLSQGNIDFGSNFDVYYGSIAVDNTGNMIIGYSYSGPTTFASSGYAVIPNGAPGPDGSITTLTQGLGPFTDVDPRVPGTARWGDYSGVVIDPSDNGSFWLFNEFAANNSVWATTIGGVHVPTLYALPVTANDLMILQQGIQAFTNSSEATALAALIDAVPAAQTVASYANQLIANNQALSQVAMADFALMTGGTDTTAHLAAISTQFLPAQEQNAVLHGFNPTVYSAEQYGLALGGNNAFATAYGGLSIAQFTAAVSAITGTSAEAITNFVNSWNTFYTGVGSNAHPGISAQLAAYGEAFGDAVGVALIATNPSALSIQAQVRNALIDIAETGTSGGATYAAGVPIASLPLHTPLQGEITPTFTAMLHDSVTLVGFTGTLTAHDFMTV